MGWLEIAPPVLVGGSFLLALLVMLLGRTRPLVAPALALIAPVLVLATGVAGLAVRSSGAAGRPPAPWVGRIVSSGSLSWFDIGPNRLSVSWTVDSLAALMLVVVGGVASMVVVFSIGYMAKDPGWARYFALLALFTGSMTLLVVAGDLTGMFVGWELVGACSFLLIGFWFEKPAAAKAAVKAFLTTRVGDAGMLLALALLWRATGSLAYRDVFGMVGALPVALLTAVALLLFVGAAGKSAQFPLHIWLPDAMEGPTPVSALIHAATMVAAGVFLVARTWPIFESAEAARGVMLGIGCLTAFGAATIAVAQRDIKKVLAYSTISQLGYMMAAMGAGAWVVGMFHLMTHAAFKALLFLAAGSVIHGAATQDLREMGGLRKAMPVTALAWLVGAGALAGIPPLSGFFSKDGIVTAVWHASPLAGLTLIAASALTAFYVTRATRLAFFGTARADGHAHESPRSMLVPLVILAIPAAVLGFTGNAVARAVGHEGESPSWVMAAVAVAVAGLGVALGWRAVREGTRGDERLEARLGAVWRAASRGWHVDAFVDRLVVRPTVALARFAYAAIDRLLVDGAVEGTGGLTKFSGTRLARIQNGDGQWYSALVGIGVLLLLVMSVWMGRVGL